MKCFKWQCLDYPWPQSIERKRTYIERNQRGEERRYRWGATGDRGQGDSGTSVV